MMIVRLSGHPLVQDSLSNALLQQHHQAGGQLPLLIELSGHVVEALRQQLHQALDALLLLIEVLLELIGHAVAG